MMSMSDGSKRRIERNRSSLRSADAYQHCAEHGARRDTMDRNNFRATRTMDSDGWRIVAALLVALAYALIARVTG